MSDRNDFSLGVQGFQDSRQTINIRRFDKIFFADENHVSELDLLNQKIRDAPLVILSQRLAGVLQINRFVIVLEKIDGIYHSHHRV